MTQLRVAVVGSGPAGLYAVEQLLESRTDFGVEIDLFERLPTPWGLVRSGVAPDHPEKKRVADRLFDIVLKNPQVRFYGNVEVGRHIEHHELLSWYDAVVYAVGATSDLRMNIPGEDLPGCWSARQFISFYNGHPDFDALRFDLSCERAIIVGSGNVALDAARVLTLPVETLERSDIADSALQLLRSSALREVVVLGRRSPRYASFHNAELEELEHLPGVDIEVAGPDLTAEDIENAEDWEARRKMETLRRLQGRPRHSGNKRIVLRFLASPVELLGDDRVEGLRIVHNRLRPDGDGGFKSEATSQISNLPTGLVLRAIGYRGIALRGLPFDTARGVIPHRDGRVVDDHQGVIPGVYVTGWIKRGCRGIIGSNRKCAQQTVQNLFNDAVGGLLPRVAMLRDAVHACIDAHQPLHVPLAGWLAIDRCERDAGRDQHRPRVKLTNAAQLLDVGRRSY